VKKNKKDLIEIIGCFRQKKIAVWGDFILDEYIYGTTRRISREAPVLILSYKAKEFSLGGGGNALLNLSALGADPVPVGVVGQDEAGKRILKMLKQKKISTDFLIKEKTYTNADQDADTGWRTFDTEAADSPHRSGRESA